MIKRRLLREVVLQALFVNDFERDGGTKGLDALNYLLKDNFPNLKGISFPLDLYNGVVKKADVIDQIIEKTAPDWPIDKIATVDRNILRMSIFEMLFSTRDDVPQKVAMNEGIELGKTFGAKNSYKFISGVLGSIYDASPKKDKEQKPKKMLKEGKVGAVVYSKKDNKFYLGLVHDIFGYWTMSKGSIPEGMNEEEGVVSVVKREMGIDAEIKEKVGENSYIATDPEKGKIERTVSYYLLESEHKKLKLEKGATGLNDVQWFSLDKISDLKIYNDILPIIKTSLEIVVGKDEE